MNFTMKRRDFLKSGTVALGASSIPSALFALENEGDIPIPFSDVTPYTQMDGTRWWKGNTHMHTMRSDGNEFSEVALAIYKRLGYNFCVLTDHDHTPSDKDFWVTAHDLMRQWKKISPEQLARIRENFPDMMPPTRTEKDGRIGYCDKAFTTIAPRLNEQGRFLAIPGNEITCTPADGDDPHFNIINLMDKPCRGQRRDIPTVQAAFDWVLEQRDRLIGRTNPTAMLTVNHPLWSSYDVKPQWMIDHPSIRFFEVNNSGSTPRYNLPKGGNDTFTHDKFWDVVNAARATAGQPLLYGVGSDDMHQYVRRFPVDTWPFAGYTRVAAPELTAEALIHAMYKGNFYASSGLDLKSVAFDRSSRTLTVEVDPKPGYTYTILFIGTKKGYDPRIKGWVDYHLPEKARSWTKWREFKLDRRVPYYSTEIGMTLQKSEGLKASYTMKPDDLYVRAKVFTQKGVMQENTPQSFPVAWTQPVMG